MTIPTAPTLRVHTLVPAGRVTTGMETYVQVGIILYY